MSKSDFERGVVDIIPQLRAYALALTRSRFEADDLVQDTLMRAWNYRDAFQPEFRLKPWLFKILRTCLYTSTARRKKIVQDSDGRHADSLIIPAEQEWFVQYNELLGALEELSPEGREAILLVLAAGLTYEEAAHICSVPVGTMKSRVNRARTQLANLLDPVSGTADGHSNQTDEVDRQPWPS